MQTKAIHFTAFGNAALVQVSSEPLTSFPFAPAGPAIRSGGLIISELTAMGSVGELTALNKTDEYLLLTDAEVLTGAKQNRVVNRSVLLPPSAKTVIEVSCVERLRWNYRSSSFSTPGSVADPNLRSKKAGTFSRMKPEDETYFRNTQGEVWDHVHTSLACEGVRSRTESYEELLKHRLAKAERAFPESNPAEGCNGLSVIIDGKVISVDLFGNEESYRYYFPMLRDAAFTLSLHGAKQKQIDDHEAYFKTLEAIDGFNDSGRKAEETYPGAGTLHMVESDRLVGFSLMANEEQIHHAFFAKL
ncbi:MAG: hypothetical protein IH591_09930 [Bacteroidales bacterium]|nr:hypothetical protein [Bacteroidales bacterium]